MAIEKTYNMIKPDGVRNGHIGEIISRIERNYELEQGLRAHLFNSELRDARWRSLWA